MCMVIKIFVGDFIIISLRRLIGHQLFHSQKIYDVGHVMNSFVILDPKIILTCVCWMISWVGVIIIL